MTDYKHTLNLPNTEFPMKANLSQREPQMLEHWANLDLYEKLRVQLKDAPTFVLHDGPPYANGHIHMGTALNKILKDIVIKSKTLAGFNAPFVPGWDCHGLPIELNVEKKVGKAGQKISAADFRKACRDYASSQIAIQKTEFKRLGIQAEWDNPYLTMNFSFEANVVRGLAKMIEKGHLEKGYKPVHWCLDCGSALAEAEVEYADKTSTAIDVRFTACSAEDALKIFNVTESLPVSVPIWTTTPWTLPANEAVALNENIDYALVKTSKEYLILAKDLVPQALMRYGLQGDVVNVVLGKALEGLKLKHPFYDKTVPLILGDHVTVDSGTGAVHTAPAHGQEDYVVAKKYQLPVENPVGDNGVFTSITPIVAGMHVSKVNDFIVNLLKENDVLLHAEKIQHSFPHCWRHKTPLIFRATPQWFISMEKANLRAMAIEAINQVEWLPDWGKSRITSMVSNRPDWCISRQRTWGVPIPLFIHKETGELHPDTPNLIERVATLIETAGIEAWFALDLHAFLPNDADQYQKISDILDVWFDSGVTHECVLKHHQGLSFPADLYLEGSDQHRGWFQSSLLTSIAINDQAPYKTVLTHGYVVDGQGRKMSKSLGNVMAPEEIIKTLGADVLRLWVASVDYRNEINVSKEILTRTSETYRRIRNTARFFLANLDGFDPALHSVASEDMIALDAWAVEKTKRLQAEIVLLFNEYQFHVIYQKIQHFCIVDMGGFYLDIIKDRQYTLQRDSKARRSAQTALFHIVEAFTRWLAPILSFTADEIWQFMPGERNTSVFLNTWYQGFNHIQSHASFDLSYWEKVRVVRDAVNKEIEAQRKAGVLGSALEASVVLYCDAPLLSILSPLENELRFILITSRATCVALDSTQDLIQTELPGLKLKVSAVTDTKCERCWHRCEEVGTIEQHPTLCARCVINIDGDGEQRLFA